MRNLLAGLCGTLLLLNTCDARAAGIQGEYLEARTADVFTGPCISNSEIFTTGNQAVLAWKVNQGAWKGTELSGLCVAIFAKGDLQPIVNLHGDIGLSAYLLGQEVVGPEHALAERQVGGLGLADGLGVALHLARLHLAPAEELAHAPRSPRRSKSW